MSALVTTWLYRNTRNGLAARMTDEIERLTGRPPPLRQYIQDYRACWLRLSAGSGPGAVRGGN